jgi:hypothetical protein
VQVRAWRGWVRRPFALVAGRHLARSAQEWSGWQRQRRNAAAPELRVEARDEWLDHAGMRAAGLAALDARLGRDLRALLDAGIADAIRDRVGELKRPDWTDEDRDEELASAFLLFGIPKEAAEHPVLLHPTATDDETEDPTPAVEQ